MDYMTLKEAAEKWGVTPRRVNYYCAGGRIPVSYTHLSARGASSLLLRRLQGRREPPEKPGTHEEIGRAHV